MALKVLLLRNKLDSSKKKLEELRSRDPDFERREAELEAAINEMTEETSEEDRKIVEGNIDSFNSEKEDHEKEKNDLEEEIKRIENEIEEEERRQSQIIKKTEERKEIIPTMENRTRFFGMSIQERDAFFAREDVKNFLSEVRTCMKEKRALSNAGLIIPEVALPMIKQITEEYSKLVKYVSVRPVGGTSRQNIMGEIPEAYWDEMCAAIKEMDLAFYSTEMDGFKVSGYFAVCNATLEDNDINLAQELFVAIGKAIGKALDKAIIYGKGVKMPMGIVTSLTRAEAPEGHTSKNRPWTDLTTTNIITGTQSSGTKLFQEIVTKSGVVENDYSSDKLVWVMNSKTHKKILAESIGINQAAAIVAGMGNTMPVVGGDIVELKFIPENTVVFGYFGAYVLAERAGTKLAQSEHVKFIEDNTVFKGTARYDGKPVIREAFAVMGIGGAPTTTPPKFAGEE